MKGNYESAIADFQKAIELNPNEPTPYENLGKAYYLKGNMQDALQAYQKLIELEPQGDQAQYYLGIVQKAMNQFDHAVQAFTQAIQRNDQEAIYYFSRGEAYYNLGEFQKAKTDFEEGLSLAPEFDKNQAIHFFMQNIKQKLSEGKRETK